MFTIHFVIKKKVRKLGLNLENKFYFYCLINKNMFGTNVIYIKSFFEIIYVLTKLKN